MLRVRSRRGRPRRNGAQIISIQVRDSPMCIADSQLASEVMKLIVCSAPYKNLILTGPAKEPKISKATLDKVESANYQLKQKLTTKQYEEVYFLNSAPKSFVLDTTTEILSDETEYLNLLQENLYGAKYKPLIFSLNLVIKQLDEKFSKILQKLLDHYLCRDIEETTEETINRIISVIRENQNNEFEYLEKWEELMLITQETRCLVKEEQLQKLQEKIQKKSDKIQRKYIDQIENQYKEIEDNLNSKPIDLFVDRFITLIDQYIEQQGLQEIDTSIYLNS